MEHKDGEHMEHCKMCVWHDGGKHVLLRWILGVVILLIVFSIGMKIGEFRGSFGVGGGYYGGFHGPGMMWRGYGGYNNQDYYNNNYPGPGMMRGQNWSQ